MSTVPNFHNTAQHNPRLIAALDYLASGWSAFPLCSPDHAGISGHHQESCKNPGKTPLLNWKAYQESLPSETEVRLFWTRWPNANVGIALGPVSGLLALDIDGPDGETKLLELSAGVLPVTLQFSTPGGGRRLLYAWPDTPLPIKTFAHKGKEALRILSRGSQTVMPPSLHVTGGQYSWVPGRGPHEIAPAPCPQWLIDLLTRSAVYKDDQVCAKPTFLQSNSPLPDAKLLYRAQKYLDKCEPAISGHGGHKQTFKVACKLVRRLGLDAQTAYQLMLQRFNPRCYPPWSERELRHKVQDAAKLIGETAPMNSTTTNSLASTLAICPNAPSDWPAPMHQDAFHGLAGDLIRLLSPESEADPAALLAQFLVGFGNAIGGKAKGCRPHFVAGRQHFCNEFLLLIGDSATGCKGTSWACVESVLTRIDSDWATKRIQSGLATGEGLVWHLRDAAEGQLKSMKNGVESYIQGIVDHGVADKRLLVIEEEFSQVLRLATRVGNTLATQLRQAWDSARMQGLTKGQPAAVSAPHLSVIAHCTMADLNQHLSDTDRQNGFANRFLMICVKRFQYLPHGGNINPAGLDLLLDRLRDALAFATTVGELCRDADAKELWEKRYPDLADGPPGLAGALLARGAPHVMRLACTYAVLDKCPQINLCHLKAAFAFWDYCVRSVKHVFGNSLGDATADKLEEALMKDSSGLSRDQINNQIFQRNKTAADIQRALELLQRVGRAHCVRIANEQGPQTEMWFHGREPSQDTN